MANFSRRQFLITAGAATTGAVALNTLPSYVAAATIKPETTKAKLGFIALTDSAPLIIAEEKKIFDKYGMTGVEVMKQTSWAVTRDNLELGGGSGGIDGAHVLTPIPYLMSMGKITKGNNPVPMQILARLNTNGQGITISKEYAALKVGVNSAPLKKTVDALKAKGQKMKMAMTFPGGTHDLWLRYWLAAGGIDPDKDADLIVIPPPQMVANMETNTMDVFCVGEPWNDRAISKKIGYSAITTGELWKNHPEKSFAMRGDWVKANPKAAQAITMAIQEAQVWCDNPANKEEMCNILAKDKYVKAPAADIIERIRGTFDMGNGRVLKNSPLVMKFWSDGASYPHRSHDTWFLTELVRWGKLPANTNIASVVGSVNRDDIWKAAAGAIGQKAPAARGVETFFDGVKFDASNPQAYLKSLKIKRV
jgi:nitrate/nitrite transport system substrate-binding protein